MCERGGRVPSCAKRGELKRSFTLGFTKSHLDLIQVMYKVIEFFGATQTKMMIRECNYHRSSNFRVQKLSYDKFSCKKIFVGTIPYRVSVNSVY